MMPTFMVVPPGAQVTGRLLCGRPSTSHCSRAAAGWSGRRRRRGVISWSDRRTDERKPPAAAGPAGGDHMTQVSSSSRAHGIDERDLGRYADLILRCGVNVEPGQKVLITGDVEHAYLIAALAERA